jgi:hypothetical protein
VTPGLWSIGLFIDRASALHKKQYLVESYSPFLAPVGFSYFLVPD